MWLWPVVKDVPVRPKPQAALEERQAGAWAPAGTHHKVRCACCSRAKWEVVSDGHSVFDFALSGKDRTQSLQQPGPWGASLSPALQTTLSTLLPHH